MADRWYLKGIHVPVNRFGSEENKKRESPTNRTARVSNRHSFSPSGEKIKGGNLKGHPYFFEAKVAVPHRGARLGPAGRLGKKSSSRSALRYFFLPSLDTFPAGERL